MSRSRRLLTLLATIMLVAASACSSTTRLDSLGQAEDSTGPEERGPQSFEQALEAEQPGPAAGATGEQAAEETQASAFVPGRGQGITDEAITIGLIDQGNLEDTFGTFFGFETEGPSYTDRQKGDALVEWFNARGGIAGRQIDPVWVHYDPFNESLAENLAKRCAAFTQDHEVFATLPFGIGWECFSQGNVIAIDAVLAQFHQSEYEAASSFLYSVRAMTTDRVARSLAYGLDEAGFFDGAKIGLVYFDWPGWKAAVPALERALAERGHSLEDKVEIGQYGDAQTLGQAQIVAANAVLRFKARDINRVLFFDATFLGPSFFMNQAESQDYRPRYGLHSGFTLDVMVTQNAPGLSPPKEQLVGSMAVGWSQPNDIGDRAELTPTRHRCQRIMSDAGVWYHDEPMGMCESFDFLKMALERADEASIEGLRASVNSLGSDFGPREGFKSFFGPSQLAAAAAYRLLKFTQGCQCYEYFGTVKDAP